MRRQRLKISVCAAIVGAIALLVFRSAGLRFGTALQPAAPASETRVAGPSTVKASTSPTVVPALQPKKFQGKWTLEEILSDPSAVISALRKTESGSTLTNALFQLGEFVFKNGTIDDGFAVMRDIDNVNALRSLALYISRIVDRSNFTSVIRGLQEWDGDGDYANIVAPVAKSIGKCLTQQELEGMSISGKGALTIPAWRSQLLAGFAAAHPQDAAALMISNKSRLPAIEWGDALVALGRADPSFDALKFIESTQSVRDPRNVHALVLAESEKNPARAMEIIQSTTLVPSEARAALVREIVGTWARFDLRAAADWINAAPMGPNRDSAIAGMVTASRQINYNIAELDAWIQSVSDPTVRASLGESRK